MMKGTTKKRYTLVSMPGQDLFEFQILAIFGDFLAILHSLFSGVISLEPSFGPFWTSNCYIIIEYTENLIIP